MDDATGIQSKEITWEAQVGNFTTGRPRMIGQCNPAVLRRTFARRLILEGKFDLPGTNWLLLVAVVGAAIVLISVSVLFELHVEVMAIAAVLYGIHAALRGKGQRELSIDLTTDSPEAVIDTRHETMAFLIPFENKQRWVSVKILGPFDGPALEVRSVMGDLCRDGNISKLNMNFVWLVVGLFAAFFLMFAYLMITASMNNPAAK